MTVEQLQSAVRLLRDPDLSMSLIAERLGLPRPTISRINKKYGVRRYDPAHPRSRWTVKGVTA